MLLKEFKKKDILSERWLLRYINFIDRFNFENGHKHHILPQSLFPEFKDLKKHKFNCKILSFRAHFIAHYILSKAIGGKMLFAFNRMCNTKEKLKINSILYSEFKKCHSKIVSDFMKVNNPMFNEETKIKVSKSNTGKKASEETKAKMSKNSYMKTDIARKQKSEQMKKNNPMLDEKNRLAVSKAKTGVPRSEETKRILSIAKMGINVGKEHFRTKTILIYDEFNRLKYFCEEGFANFCKRNCLPLKGFNESYKNNKKFNTRNNKYKEYIGWKIKKLNQTNVVFGTLVSSSSELF